MPSLFERWQAAVCGRFALYPSTISYIAWALLYALLLVFGWFHAGVPRLFAGILLADIIINFVSPFIIGAGGLLAALLLKRGVKAPWAAYPFLLLAFLLGIVIPVAVLFRFGGWLLLAGAFLFFMRVNWMYMEARRRPLDRPPAGPRARRPLRLLRAGAGHLLPLRGPQHARAREQ